MIEPALTRNTDMTTASIELQAGAGAVVLFRLCINMDAIWAVLHVLHQHCKARAIIFPSPIDGSLSPVSPEDILLEYSYGERILDPLHNHLSVLTRQSGPLNFVSKRSSKVRKKLSREHATNYIPWLLL